MFVLIFQKLFETKSNVRQNYHMKKILTKEIFQKSMLYSNE